VASYSPIDCQWLTQKRRQYTSGRFAARTVEVENPLIKGSLGDPYRAIDGKTHKNRYEYSR